MAKKKRTLSAAQKQALKKGRAALAKKRKGGKAKPKTKRRTTATKSTPKRKTTKNRTPGVTFVTIAPKKKKSTSGGTTMAKRKKSTRQTAKRYAKRAIGAGRGFLKKAGIQKSLTDASMAVAGGVLAGLVVNKIPIKDARIRAALPILAGIGLAGTIGAKNNIARGVANGMIVLGAVGLFKRLAPNVPMLAGEEVFYFPNYQPQMSLPNYAGEALDLGQDAVNFGYDDDEYISAAAI